MKPQDDGLPVLAGALANWRWALAAIGLMSGMSNVLMLTGSMFMLEVYDRVLPSRSVPTLLGLAALAIMMFVFQGTLDVLRGRVLTRIGERIGEHFGRRVYDATIRLPLKVQSDGDGLQPLRDLDKVRGFMGAGGPAALFDLPWMPLYLAVCFIFHVWIGMTASIGALMLVTVTVLTEVMIRRPTRMLAGLDVKRNSLAQAGQRNAEVLQAMGMGPRLALQWEAVNQQYLAAQERVSDVAGGFGSVSRVLRIVLQSCVLGVGAYLVIQQEATAGVIIAGSILSARALAPVELAIANWKGFVEARNAWARLESLIELFPVEAPPMNLPAPRESLSAEAVMVIPPGGQKPVVKEASFCLSAGQAVGIIGPSGSGKSSLVRALVGVWPTFRGKIRLDGAAIDQWSTEALGGHIGYLPQNVELFDATVAKNIARLAAEPDGAAVVAAARAAAVHEMILGLPEGYETRIGEGGKALSAGQRQRVALACALYGNPFLVVLDEPNSNLDNEGEAALTQAILGVRARGGIVVVVAHRPSALAGVDQILVMDAGSVQAFGAKDEVMKRVLRPASIPPLALKVVPEGPGAKQ